MPDWRKISESTSLTDVPAMPDMKRGERYKMVIDLTPGTWDWVFTALMSAMATFLWPLPYESNVAREGDAIVITVVG